MKIAHLSAWLTALLISLSPLTINLAIKSRHSNTRGYENKRRDTIRHEPAQNKFLRNEQNNFQECFPPIFSASSQWPASPSHQPPQQLSSSLAPPPPTPTTATITTKSAQTHFTALLNAAYPMNLLSTRQIVSLVSFFYFPTSFRILLPSPIFQFPATCKSQLLTDLSSQQPPAPTQPAI